MFASADCCARYRMRQSPVADPYHEQGVLLDTALSQACTST